MSGRSYDNILAKHIHNRQGVRHGFNTSGVDFIELSEIFEDAAKLVGVKALFIIRKRQPGQFRDMLDIFGGDHLKSMFKLCPNAFCYSAMNYRWCE